MFWSCHKCFWIMPKIIIVFAMPEMWILLHVKMFQWCQKCFRSHKMLNRRHCVGLWTAAICQQPSAKPFASALTCNAWITGKTVDTWHFYPENTEKQFRKYTAPSHTFGPVMESSFRAKEQIAQKPKLNFFCWRYIYLHQFFWLKMSQETSCCCFFFFACTKQNVNEAISHTVQKHGNDWCQNSYFFNCVSKTKLKSQRAKFSSVTVPRQCSLFSQNLCFVNAKDRMSQCPQ